MFFLKHATESSFLISIGVLVIARGIHQVNVDLDPSPVLPADLVTLVCGCIREGYAVFKIKTIASISEVILVPQDPSNKLL